jgi:hypothetical protein
MMMMLVVCVWGGGGWYSKVGLEGTRMEERKSCRSLNVGCDE